MMYDDDLIEVTRFGGPREFIRSSPVSWESLVRSDFLSGVIDLAQFEDEMETVLRGGVPKRLDDKPDLDSLPFWQAF
jgi:hypothetical protein